MSFPMIRIRCTAETLSKLTYPGYAGGEVSSSENSWFPPFEWIAVQCRECGDHLGWMFVRSPLPAYLDS